MLIFLSLESLTPITRTGLSILVELIDLVNSAIIFLSQMILLRWLTLLLGSQTVIVIVLLYWIFFISSNSSIRFTMVFPPLGNSDHVVVLVPFDFPWHSQRNVLFHQIAYDYFCADWGSLCDHLRDVPWDDIFKLGAPAANSEFCEWLQVGIDVYIPHRKYQIKAHLSLWFSVAFAAAIVHRNHIFCFYQKDKSSVFKVKFGQAKNCCKRVLEATKLAYTNKARVLLPRLLPRNLSLVTFGKLLIVFSTKVNLLYLLYSTAQSCCPPHPIKQNYLLKTFLRTLILMIKVSLYLFSSLKLVWNCAIFL